MNSNNAAVEVYSSVVHDDQDVLLRDVARDDVIRQNEKRKWIRIGVISFGFVLLMALMGGIVGRLIFPNSTLPVVTPTTTAAPTTPAPPTILTTKSPSTTTTEHTSTTSTPTTVTPTTALPTFPPTKHPLPPHPEAQNPVAFLYEHLRDMGLIPHLMEVTCAHATPSVFKWNITVNGHSYTSPGGDNKKEAKDTAAMVANEEIFGLKYPTIPLPKSKCIVVETLD